MPERKIGSFVTRRRAGLRSRYRLLTFYEGQATVVVPLHGARWFFPWFWLLGVGVSIRAEIVNRERVEEGATLQGVSREALLTFPGAYTVSPAGRGSVELRRNWHSIGRTDLRFLDGPADLAWGSLLGISRDEAAAILRRALRDTFSDGA